MNIVNHLYKSFDNELVRLLLNHIFYLCLFPWQVRKTHETPKNPQRYDGFLKKMFTKLKLVSVECKIFSAASFRCPTQNRD